MKKKFFDSPQIFPFHFRSYNCKSLQMSVIKKKDKIVAGLRKVPSEVPVAFSKKKIANFAELLE